MIKILKLKKSKAFHKFIICYISNFKQKTTASTEDSFQKYKDICLKEKEKIKQFERNVKPKEQFKSQINRFILASFLILVNIYIFKQVYNIFRNFYYPYELNSSNCELLNNENIK